MKIQNYPIAKILLPYVIGIVIAYYGDFSDEICRGIGVAMAVVFLLICVLTFVKSYRWRLVQTVAMTTACGSNQAMERLCIRGGLRGVLPGHG